MTQQLEVAEVAVKIAQPVDEIVATAQQLDASLVVMGVHNRKGLERLLGSTTHGQWQRLASTG